MGGYLSSCWHLQGTPKCLILPATRQRLWCGGGASRLSHLLEPKVATKQVVHQIFGAVGHETCDWMTGSSQSIPQDQQLGYKHVINEYHWVYPTSFLVTWWPSHLGTFLTFEWPGDIDILTGSLDLGHAFRLMQGWVLGPWWLEEWGYVLQNRKIGSQPVGIEHYPTCKHQF